MKLELKNIKIVERMSEETWCYTATLYQDGKKVGEVSNRGTGGCDDFYGDQSALTAINAYLATLPAVSLGEDMTVPMDLELWCGEQLDRHIIAKDLQKALKSKVIFIDPTKPGIRQLSWKGVKTVGDVHIATAKKSYPNATILNTLPFEEALTLYKTAA